MKRLLVLAAATAVLIPATQPPNAEAGQRFCLKRNGNHRVCITKGARFDRVCFTYYLRSGGHITRCSRRYH
jgi:hypothetical protein